jgi:hypothetical protein
MTQDFDENKIVQLIFHADITNDCFLARELARFLWIMSKKHFMESDAVPSPEVDYLWRDLLLHTRIYQEICTTLVKMGGYVSFIHREKLLDKNGRHHEVKYMTTLRHYEQFFGKPPSDFWPLPDCGALNPCKRVKCERMPFTGKVFVYGINGSVRKIDVRTNKATVMDLKRQIYILERYPIHEQYLIFGNNILQDDVKLIDYNIEDGSIVNFEVRY